MPSQLELQVVPGMDGLDKSHPAVNQAAEEFYTDMHRVPGVVMEERDDEASQLTTKGVLQQLLLSPETAGAAWAIVKVVKLWLSRDRRRTLTVTVSRPGTEPLTIQASGDSITVQALEKAVHDAVGADS